MRYLLIETSTERGVVAIIEGDNCLFLSRFPQGLQSSHHLLPEMEKGFKETGLNISDIGAIVAGVGPGSYTGIRIAATAAKTLCFAKKIPLVGVCTLQTFVPEEPCTTYAVAIDAKVGGVYLQLGKKLNGTGVYDTEPQVLPLAEAAALLNEVPIIVTPSITPLRGKLETVGLSKEKQWHEAYPSVHQMVSLGKKKLALGEVSAVGDLELLYMRKTQAEIEREKTLGS